MSCDIHPWMTGYFRVFPHPYFALTDAQGRFEIKQSPATKVKLMVSHPEVGWIPADVGRSGKEVEIAPGQTLDVGDIKMPPPK